MLQIENITSRLQDAIKQAEATCEKYRFEFLTPEILLHAICSQKEFKEACHLPYLKQKLLKFAKRQCPMVPEGIDYELDFSSKMYQVIEVSRAKSLGAGKITFGIPHLISAMLSIDGCIAGSLIEQESDDFSEGMLLGRLISAYSTDENHNEHLGLQVRMFLETLHNDLKEQIRNSSATEEEDDEFDDDDDDDIEYDEIDDEDDDDELFDFDNAELFGDSPFGSDDKNPDDYLTCLNDVCHKHNPLIGREAELERTIQVLCRKDKNNPLHIGEPGVGKTAIVYGLAERLKKNTVPARLMGMKIYMLDLGALMAGTQYRGDMEKRLKKVLTKLEQQKNAILYIDEIHNVIGAGAVSGDTLDVSNILKPYLEKGTICFMGATTYDEYNRTFSRSKAFARRFEKIDITEPSVEECRIILKGLQHKYEEYHNLIYTDDAIDYAVTGAAKYITGRFLPDKAIDLIDEAGAWRELHPNPDDIVQTVDRQLIAEVLAKICNVETLAEDRDESARLEGLDERIKSQIYGQDKAVREVTEAVQMASAGLTDDNKPMASLLFVGPTGVGKTEVAKVLANELSLPLLRFDMSEYAEKHTVAKLIGSPAGYVGYEDGGLLTDAIRKTPHCVLLFDEIEKAHEDIYNILLQVMDYAVLTDNKGQKADFRHVVFIMTTNAGAQYARQAGVGFNNMAATGETMMKSVKKTFKPEFLNRLTAITIFNDMDRTMAQLILDKKLRQLSQRIAAKGIEMHLQPEAVEFLLTEGFSVEYGGREIDRVITNRLKPMLMRAILFGPLRNGGKAVITVENNQLVLK